jgi:histone arginine demethylase JMJD6
VYDQQTVPIRRIKREDITPEWFHENVACLNQPIIIEDAFKDWPAMHRWSIEALEERFRQVPLKVAKDDKGKKLRMKFKYYADYIRNQQDDSPLYLFETNMDDNSYIRPLMEDYAVPDLFPHDWLGLVNQDSRPPYRWFCIGPKRSGTTVHTDPLATSAWNAVTHGTKHWVLFEPQESRKEVKGKGLIKKGEDDEAIMYYDFILPRIKKAYPNLRVYEGLQKAGELIFVPGDWWHGVLNREDTVAVTQNYVGPDNFDLVWKRTRKEREKVAYLWLRNMRRFAPRLHERALALNRKDGFRMRHERPAGEKLPSGSSSSSDSSSDSSTDDAADLDDQGLETIIDKGCLLGTSAFKLQGRNAPSRAGLARGSKPCEPSGESGAFTNVSECFASGGASRTSVVGASDASVKADPREERHGRRDRSRDRQRRQEGGEVEKREKRKDREKKRVKTR